jgi:toxin ParE1/3/4
MGQLAQNPKLGKPRETIRVGYRSIQINRHVAYYRMKDRRIEIVRVLHERMDPWHHLEE